MGSDNLRRIFEEACGGSFQSCAKLLTSLERLGPQAAFKDIPELLDSGKACFRLGVTGPPGAGKSTLISQLLTMARAEGLRVAVLAVDPSSPFSKGAILGDRIRYSDHFLDPEVYIRSIGTRGALGGLSGSAYLMLRAFDLMPFDLVLIETVGVGQTELEVVHVADFVSVVLVPESGDGIQTMKAGLTEISDLFVINKKDRPGAESLKLEIESQAQQSEKEVKVLLTNAISGEGVKELYSIIRQAQKNWSVEDRQLQERVHSEAKAFLRAELETELEARVKSVENLKDLFPSG